MTKEFVKNNQYTTDFKSNSGYLPKKKSFAHLTDEFIIDSLFSINARPRKSRGWVSPADILNS